MTPAPIIIEGPEQSLLDLNLPDGGLPPALGVQSFQVFRASRDCPDITDRKGWTYHHHVDIAAWKGLLYVAWNSCEKDEDTWPSRELYSTSSDGQHWSDPQELFPQGVSTPLRMYFFLAANGRMLAIAGLRLDHDNTDEDLKGGLVVREIFSNHQLGPIFTLQLPHRAAPGSGSRPIPEFFDRSTDPDFILSCKELLSDTVFLEQQDRGRLIDAGAMLWHRSSAWPQGKIPGDSDKWVAGKAYSFFRRPDQTLVGISKMGWTTISTDDGKTWSQPLVPPTLITGKAKVWTQRTSDGGFALVYNPSRKHRFPLTIVTSEDGIHFHDMRIVQGELPVQRYEGKFRSVGPQYVRGLSTWSDDGSRASESAIWLVYSMSKEDIWVSRVPVPVQPDETSNIQDENDFSRWNLYSPRWSPISVERDWMHLTDADPFDYARAVRLFPESTRVRIDFQLRSTGATNRPLEVELMGKFGSSRPVRVPLTFSRPDQQLNCRIFAECESARYRVSIDGVESVDQPFAEPSTSLCRLSFRSGPYRAIGGSHPVAPGSDRPRDPAIFHLSNVRIETE
jgi:hypothetical protein